MWKETIEGYLISEYGDVMRIKTGKILVCEVNKKGYKRIVLKGKHYFIHRLVAIAYVENPFNYPQINHIDYNKQNNHYSNLEWCTNQHNALHSYKNERMPGRVKLSIIDLENLIRDIKSNNFKEDYLALKYKVSIPTIQAVKVGRNIKRLLHTTNE